MIVIAGYVFEFPVNLEINLDICPLVLKIVSFVLYVYYCLDVALCSHGVCSMNFFVHCIFCQLLIDLEMWSDWILFIYFWHQHIIGDVVYSYH